MRKWGVIGIKESILAVTDVTDVTDVGIVGFLLDRLVGTLGNLITRGTAAGNA